MNHWSLQTAEGSWFFSSEHKKLMGIRCTHQPSPWIGDYGSLCVMPQTGVRRLNPDRWSSSYRLEKSDLSPAGIQVELIADGTKIEFAPTERAGVFEFSYAASGPRRVVLQPCQGSGELEIAKGAARFCGWTDGNAGGVPAGYRMFFVGEFSKSPDAHTLFSNNETKDGAEKLTGPRVGICAEWQKAPTITLRIATSFISVDQAWQNLKEVEGQSAAQVKQQNQQIWEQNLSRIIPEGGTEKQQRTFTTCFYRTQLFPRIWHEVASDGSVSHRSPYDGKVHPGVLYTDNGFWDTYRTEYPLLGLIDPDRTSEIMQGWVHAYQEGGWFPQWASPGYRACMVGTHIDSVIAEAVAHGITNFDLETAYAGMLKHAEQVGAADGAFGRIGIKDYLAKGYVSTDHHESVARSLDYAYNDWCLYQVGKALGKPEQKYLARSKNYKHLWHSELGFMRARTATGEWAVPNDQAVDQPWSEFRWGDPYVEGGPWQSLWSVPHDVDGLIQLLGGRDVALQKLQHFLAQPPRFEVGAYGFEIHEMTEMAAVEFGQYAHSNQPVHHVLYLFNVLGRPDLTRHWVHRVLNELYSPEDLPGDEDNGEMSAWFVLSSMGLYAACPGSGMFTTVQPLFDRVSVKLPTGKTLRSQSRTITGENLGCSVPYNTIKRGGTLAITEGSCTFAD